MDPTQLVVLGSAVGTVIFGVNRAVELEDSLNNSSPESTALRHEMTEAEPGTKSALLGPLLGSGVLIAAFVFPWVMMWIMSGLIVISATFAVAGVVWPWFSNTPSETVQKYLSFGAGLSVVIIWWFSGGHWILNNLICVAIGVNGITTLRLPSGKLAVYAGLSFMVYDAFWVFASEPVIGDNVMVAVAKSMDLPIKMVFPSLMAGVTELEDGTKVWAGWAMLGLGDIILPGVVCAYAARLDWVMNQGTSLKIASLSGYIVGMFMTLIAVNAMGIAQPALIYLVPCVLGALYYNAKSHEIAWEVWSGAPLTRHYKKLDEEAGEEEERALLV